MSDKQTVEDILTNRPGNYYAVSDEKERDRFRNWFRSVLRDNEAVVVFEKADGTVRDMRCTLMESRLPARPDTAKSRAENPNVCVVWDCDRDVWRSFRWDRMKQFNFTLGSDQE